MSEGGKRNSWLTHVKKTMKSHKGMKFGQVLKLAKKTYKKTGGGVQPHSDFGGSADLSYAGPSSSSPFHPSDAAPAGGSRRTRRGRKSRRGGKMY
jgi:hypothetical protein